MNSVLRRERLVALLRERNTMSVQEIQEQFNVSRMTIHRDLCRLESQGLIRKLYGGIVPRDTEAERRLAEDLAPNYCVNCCLALSGRLTYILTLSDGAQRYACCPRCGLEVQRALGGEIISAVATDFITGRPHPAHRSAFLMGSSAHSCCAPSILTFDNEKQAHRFQTGFGGKVGYWEDAMKFLGKDGAVPASPPERELQITTAPDEESGH